MSIILLDIGNVVVSFDFHAFCRSVVPEGSVNEESVYQKYCTGELKTSFERGMIAPFDFLRTIAEDPMTLTMQQGDIRSAWQKIFSPLPEAESTLEKLAGEHRIWIMSDTDPLHFCFLLNNYPMLRNRERYYLSYEHGHIKNSSEAFNHVLRDSGLPATDFVLIDDKPENCAAAAEAGIRSIRFNSWPETLEALADLH
jgi:HAD superfamily hydrolase (TIGR01509 family)